MELIPAVLSGFVLAAAAPWIHRYAGRWTGWLLALLPAGLAVYFGVRGGIALDDDRIIRSSYDWAPGLDVALSFQLDGLGLLFALLVSVMGAIVLAYSGGYLAGNERIGQFYGYILLFMASMLGLVLADNIITLYIFWELTSISSFFLIGFDNQRQSARDAALQALLVTTGGGLALFGGLVLVGIAGGSFELSTLLAGEGLQEHALYTPILILVLAGAFTKSAQFPFHFWLPSAMEAPAPVSAYLHSATMVKAGVYLLARFNPILGGTDEWRIVVTAAGAATMVVGAYLALQQTDLKRILAYSTVAVLGTLTMLLGIDTEEAFEGMVVFLFAHAMYKGALFLVAGAVDHETGARDIRELSGLRSKMPLTATAAIFAALSMAGLVPLFGFIGKELVLEAAVDATEAQLLLTILTVGASMVLVAVAGIVGMRPFVGGTLRTPKTPHEAPVSMWLGPLLLAALGLTVGIQPQLVEGWLLSPAVSSIERHPVELGLTLWHGFVFELLLSVIALIGGVVVFALRGQIRRAGEYNVLREFGPARWYSWFLLGINKGARLQTMVLQSGYLRVYLQITIVATVAIVGYTLIDRGGLDFPEEWTGIRFYEIGVAAVILIAALAAALLTSRLGSVAAIGVIGFGIALIFVLYGAPDLAMTQFLVETLTVILFVLVFYHLPRFEPLSTVNERLRDATIAIALGALMTGLVLAVTVLPADPHVSPYYIENSRELAHGRNIVNVILVDFRALDTLGEITVLAAAGIGVFALLKLRPHRAEDKRRTDDE
jgi:multicomponent Na+:H+ antiporter subunit A